MEQRFIILKNVIYRLKDKSEYEDLIDSEKIPDGEGGYFSYKKLDNEYLCKFLNEINDFKNK
jgi:hypothetical protein